jgi:ribosomal protein S18 acetylase RimI-like enzyme
VGISTRKRDKAGGPSMPIPAAITIRRLRAGDDAVLAYLATHNAVFGTVDEREALHPLTEAETIAFLNDDRTTTFVAFAGDEPVGFVYTTELYRRHTALRHLCIYEIGVAERFRNQGIGEALMESVADHARTQGITQGFVITNASNPAASHLYESVGGVRTADDDVIFGFSWR